MSSHHIVREKQEPALLIMSLEGFSAEYLGQLLEWSPTVIVAESVYEQADSMGIKIDGLVTNNQQYHAQEHTRFIPYEAEILEDALKYLVAEGYPAVNIIASHFALKDYVFFVDLINLVIFNPGSKIFPVRTGFSKWAAAGEKVYLMHDINHLEVQGLQQVKHHQFVTEKDGFYSLAFHQPFIFIAEEL
jgi:thiamine pyrophosphokinase